MLDRKTRPDYSCKDLDELSCGCIYFHTLGEIDEIDELLDGFGESIRVAMIRDRFDSMFLSTSTRLYCTQFTFMS